MNNPERENGIQTNSTEPDTFPLDDAVIRLIAEYQSQLEQAAAAQRGALTLFIRQHELQGNWKLAPGGRELVKGE